MDSNRLLKILKFLDFLQRDSNPRKRDSNRLKMIELLENGFESLKEGFESLENFLATGNRIRIFKRGIQIALKHFWLLENGFESLKEGFESLRHFLITKDFFGDRDSNRLKRDSNRLTQKCMNAPENVRKCSTNMQFHSSYKHTTQKDLTNMNI